jgi:hypothetical protein
LGAQTIYPTTTGNNQIASEKDYPIDFSHFNINSRVFGAQGTNETQDEAIDIKFGQAAKGTQPVIQVKDLETALVKQQHGNLVSPDPGDPSVQKAYHEGVCPNFYTYGKNTKDARKTCPKDLWRIAARKLDLIDSIIKLE